MAALENRQEAILAQLADLKNQITVLRAQLKQPPICTVREDADISTNKACNILQVCFHFCRTNRCFIYVCYSIFICDFCFQNGVIHDIVINASPRYPPYSIAALRRLWSDGLKLGVHCHIHSSILELPKNLDKFLCLVSNSDQERSPLLNITLVWKDGN